MSTQKFIAREAHRFDNGAIGWRPGGPFDCLGPYAKVQSCPVHGVPGLRLTCYATGYADTFFSVPACTRHRGHYISGYFSTETGTTNGIEFRPHTRHTEHLRAPAPPVPPIRPDEDAAHFLATVLWLRDGYEERKLPQHRTRKNWTIHEIHPELVAAVRQFCQGFREYLDALPDDLFPVNWENYLERSFGGSVFFTLSGHGCSFRDEYSDPDRTLGDTLADALEAYAGDRHRFEELEHDLSPFNGKLHISRRTAAARSEALARYFPSHPLAQYFPAALRDRAPAGRGLAGLRIAGKLSAATDARPGDLLAEYCPQFHAVNLVKVQSADAYPGAPALLLRFVDPTTDSHSVTQSDLDSGRTLLFRVTTADDAP